MRGNGGDTLDFRDTVHKEHISPPSQSVVQSVGRIYLLMAFIMFSLFRTPLFDAPPVRCLLEVFLFVFSCFDRSMPIVLHAVNCLIAN